MTQAYAVVTLRSVFEDIVGKLATAVAAKLRALEEQRDMLHGALVAALTTWQDTKRELVSAEAAATPAQDGDRRDVDGLNRARHSGTPEPPSARAAAALTALERAQDREASRRRAREESQAAWEMADRLLTAVRELLRTSDPALLVPVVVERREPKAPRDAASISRVCAPTLRRSRSSSGRSTRRRCRPTKPSGGSTTISAGLLRNGPRLWQSTSQWAQTIGPHRQTTTRRTRWPCCSQTCRRCATCSARGSAAPTSGCPPASRARSARPARRISSIAGGNSNCRKSNSFSKPPRAAWRLPGGPMPTRSLS